MTVSADYHLPALFDLTSSSVQGIQTSEANPRIVLDSQGLRALDPFGKPGWWLPSNYVTEGLIIPIRNSGLPHPGLTWTRDYQPDDVATEADIMEITGTANPDRLKRRIRISTSASAPPANSHGEIFLNAGAGGLRLGSSQAFASMLDNVVPGTPGSFSAQFGLNAGGDGLHRTILDAFNESIFPQIGNGEVADQVRIYGGYSYYTNGALVASFGQVTYSARMATGTYEIRVGEAGPSNQILGFASSIGNNFTTRFDPIDGRTGTFYFAVPGVAYYDSTFLWVIVVF